MGATYFSTDFTLLCLHQSLAGQNQHFNPKPSLKIQDLFWRSIPHKGRSHTFCPTNTTKCTPRKTWMLSSGIWTKGTLSHNWPLPNASSIILGHCKFMNDDIVLNFIPDFLIHVFHRTCTHIFIAKISTMSLYIVTMVHSFLKSAHDQLPRLQHHLILAMFQIAAARKCWVSLLELYVPAMITIYSDLNNLGH